MQIYITNNSMFCMHLHTCTAALQEWVFVHLNTGGETQHHAAMQSLEAVWHGGEGRAS